uniref:PDZ domain-containing protein n=1 Tax=Anopheles stephensi TaxID=30069 RepID=A0A182Y8D0_ANOST
MIKGSPNCRWVWDLLGFVTVFFWSQIPIADGAMTRKQLINSMDMMRSACAPKFKVSTEMLDNLRNGIFAEDRELKCYTMCIAQMAGTMSKKGEINIQKTLAQLDAMLPPDMKEKAKEAVHACRDAHHTMNSHLFPGRTTPETMVGGIRKWEQLSRTTVNRTYRPFDEEFRAEAGSEHQRKDESESDQEPSSAEDQYNEQQHYSESEFHTEQEEEEEDSTEEPARIQVSQYPPMNIEPDGHLLHIDFISNQLERFVMPSSGQNRGQRRTATGTLGSGHTARKLPGQQHNISFSRERVREIERTNQILLRRIITTRPTLQTQNIKPVKRSSSTNASPVTSAATNRRKAQERIAAENELLIRKGEGGKIGVTGRRLQQEGKLLICAVARRSPAYMAGLRYGDEILSLENEPVSGVQLERVRELVRNNQRNSIKLRSKDKPGERYVTIARDVQKGFGFRFVNGEITFVRPNTVAERRGLERRLQIIEVNEEVVVGMQDEDIEAIIYANGDVVTLCVVPVKVYRQLFTR